LDHLVDDTAYNRQKGSLEKEFTTFLKDYRGGKGIEDANPDDIRLFLVLKDKKGKTQVHDICCQFLGKRGSFACSCPHRLAVGTVRAVLGKLKTIFASYGKGHEWDTVNKFGNPACCTSVKKYIKAIQLEQSMSHVYVKQAKPLFLRKLRDISSYIASQLEDSTLSLSKRYVLLRDQAFFKIQFFSGDRAHDLGLSLSQEVLVLEDGSGLKFSHTVGKTLGSGKVNEFVVPNIEESLLCPVMAYRSYVNGSLDMGVDLRTGYLFRTLDPSKTLVTNYPVSCSTMSDRLKKYLSVLGIDEGETPHGIRGACAITLATSGAVAGEVMEHIGWATDSSYKRYSRIGKMLGKNSVGNIMTKLATNEYDQSESIFKKLNG
jgi:integrase